MKEQTNEDDFILDRDQRDQSRQRPSKSPPKHNLINPSQPTIIYEIVKTANQHVVLVRERRPITTVNVEDDQGTIRRFTQDNPVIPDDVLSGRLVTTAVQKGTVRAVTRIPTLLGAPTTRCEMTNSTNSF